MRHGHHAELRRYYLGESDISCSKEAIVRNFSNYKDLHLRVPRFRDDLITTVCKLSESTRIGKVGGTINPITNLPTLRNLLASACSAKAAPAQRRNKIRIGTHLSQQVRLGL